MNKTLEEARYLKCDQFVLLPIRLKEKAEVEAMRRLKMTRVRLLKIYAVFTKSNPTNCSK